ncbi:replication protein A subunit RPA32 [Stereum hirsutum FP-91666 SS1]|uniref:replication protein A subunit RPA32 n=1 Tax=Stereum hirsutum (strain FP-91666) TaxID=721885 RepID=UPI000440E44D|nr:replication protein A subunit RPA32 [Stereum hirsutum FP-91666 SS1]EIM90097.1 replication protein A subunit RPA32 [Stereum hirsutum FP-91666 SS1]
MSQYGNENPYYSNTQGGSGGGGGGYLTGNSPFGGSPGGAARRGALSQSLRPMTIKQIGASTQAHADADWIWENTEIGQITVVAQVLTIKAQTTNCVYTIDDGTDQIDARFWSDSTNENEGDDSSTIKELQYARITGTIKTYNDKKYINCINIRPAKDSHEIYFHLSEAMAVTLFHERGSVRFPPKSQPAVAHVCILQPSGAQAPSGAGQSTNSNSAYTAQTSIPADDQYAHLPPCEKAIAYFMHTQPRHEEGIHVSNIARNVPFQAPDIGSALEALMDHGILYSTIDETHYALSA